MNIHALACGRTSYLIPLASEWSLCMAINWRRVRGLLGESLSRRPGPTDRLALSDVLFLPAYLANRAAPEAGALQTISIVYSAILLFRRGKDCLLLNFKRREQMLSHHLPGPLRVPSLYTVQHLNVCGHHALDEIAFR